MNKRFFQLFLVTVLFLTIPGIQAEPVNLRELFNSYETGKLGGEQDTWNIASQLEESLPVFSEVVFEDYQRSEELVRASILPQLNIILNSLESEINDPLNQGRYGKTEALRPLKQPLIQAYDNISAGNKEGPSTPTFWQFDFESGFDDRISSEIYTSLLDLVDVDPSSDDSLRAYESTRQMLRYARVTERVFTYYTKLKLIKIKEAITELYRKRWDFYFEKTRPQFIWELKLNSDFYNKRRKGKRALQQPPNHQWILLHPSVALEYIDTALDGNRFKQAIVLEVIGYNKWHWRASDGMKRALGVSLITSYSDRSKMHDIGYGVMLHYKHKFSVGYTNRSSNTGYFVSFDLGKTFTEASDELEKAFKYGK